MTADANAQSRAYIASQYSHRSGPAFEMARPRRISWWAWFVNLSALACWVVIGLVAWVAV